MVHAGAVPQHQRALVLNNACLLRYVHAGPVPQHQRAAGGGGEAGTVSPRDVRRHPRRESAGRGLRAHSRLP